MKVATFIPLFSVSVHCAAGISGGAVKSIPAAAVFATVAVFGFSHNEWLAGILCGAAFQWLVLRKNRLGDAMTAHAITNLLLGGWIVWKGAWHFW
jgi:CAAX prenyl protease-like protein